MKIGRTWFLGLLPLVISCRTAVEGTDGNTSWYADCATDGDCRGGLTCECGVCTRACTTNASCTSGRCAEPGSALMALSCGGAPKSSAVCLPESSAATSADAATPVAAATPPPPATSDAATSPPPSSSNATDPPPENPVAATPNCDVVTDPLNGTGPTVSLRNDLLPMFGQSCVASTCHNPRDKETGLNLGYKCDYDAAAKWKCTFPAAVIDPDPAIAQPDDEQTIAEVYADLLANSLTAPSVKRVVPRDPANSFLVTKLAGHQNDRGYTCLNQDSSRDTTPCGGSMPLTGTAFCIGATLPRFQAIVQWIAQGAQNN